MQKIQKFQFGRLYIAPKSTKVYELIDRNGHYLIFKVRNPKTRDSWKLQATSTYQADASGAFEEVLFMDGVCLRSDTWCSGAEKVLSMDPRPQTNITKTMTDFAA